MNWKQLLSAQRIGQKQPASHATRSAFEQDYDRIIFSYPFRRLQDKTQVFPLPKEDFVHTRLTHSLEVSSVGRSLGKRVGEVLVQRHPALAEEGISQYDFGAIVAAASLTHDLGNPPFGHCGEAAISDFFRNSASAELIKPDCSEQEWADLTNFEGNAQGFRLLNKESYQGLKLSFATLAAFSKYPCESLLKQKDPDRISQKKYGFFQSEKAIFREVAAATGMLELGRAGDHAWCRHPLAFLVEAADDICYHVIDLEDGCRMGLVTFEQTRDLLAELLGDRYQPEKLARIKSKNEQISLLRALAIGALIQQAADIFLDNETSILAGTFEQSLVDLIPAAPVMEKIKRISIEKIYRSQVVLETEIAGFEVLGGLLDVFVSAAYYKKFDNAAFSPRHRSTLRLLPEEYEPEKQDTAYALAMCCLDYVSGLTDSHAVALYRRIKGTALPVL
jgi:dGTPase